MEVEESVLIRTSPQKVFEFISRAENAHRWQSASVENHLENPDGMRLGAKIIHLGKVMGIKYTTESTVTIFEPPSSFRYEGTAWGMPMVMDYLVTPAGEGAQLTLRTESELKGVFRLFVRQMQWWTRNMFRDDLARLKRVVESEDILAGSTG